MLNTQKPFSILKICLRMSYFYGDGVFRKFFLLFFRELTSIGVKCVLPKAGFYCMPCFDLCTQKFKARGITTGAEMCAAMLAEAGVAVS